MSNLMEKVYIIAEIGVNHNGSISVAKKLIKIAKKSGADAVKFQTYDSNLLVAPLTRKAEYQEQDDKDDTQLVMLKKYELSQASHRVLLDYSDKIGIDFISTPFDIKSLKFLVTDLKLKTIKISSTDITNIPYLLEVGSTKANILISSGMSDLNDVIIALSALCYGNKFKKKETKYNFNPVKNKNFYTSNHKYLNSKVTLLHCTSEYPAPSNELNLNILETYTKLFNIPIGYSDHSNDLITPVIAVAKGASVLEAHITLDKNGNGPDHKASLEPDEFKKYIENVRNTTVMLGSNIKKITKSEKKNIKPARKSLILSVDMKKGQIVTVNDIDVKRPGNGIKPKYFYKYIGKKINKTLNANHVLRERDFV